jgi:hypothetical protein
LLGKLLKLGKSMRGDVAGPEQLAALFEGMGLDVKMQPLATAEGPTLGELQREMSDGVKRGGKFFTIRVRSNETGGTMTALVMTVETPTAKKGLTA